MKGILIVNGFLNTGKFRDIHGLLLDAARDLGIRLELRKSSGLMHRPEALRGLEADFCLFWDKDVHLARMLETAGIPVFNGADAIEACDDKALTWLRLADSGIPMPRTILAPLTYEGIGYTDTGFVDEAAEVLGYPMILKELHGSFGHQVYLARERAELPGILERIGAHPFLMQQFIASSFGRDLRVNVAGGRAVVGMLRVNEHGDFRSNITGGGTGRPWRLTERQAELAAAACRGLGLDFGGVDLLFGPDDEPILCEVNSNPHFRSTLDATGIDLAPFILEHIRERLGSA